MLAQCPEHDDWSLPSNHSAIAAAFAVALAAQWRKITSLVVLLALLEGFSRVFIGVHYPHDVLLGFFVGGMVAAVVVAETERSGDVGGIRFYPDGQSSGGEIALTLDGRSARIAVNWLTGEPRLMQ